ncbi:hypothetical protein [Erwinia aphidicola]
MAAVVIVGSGGLAAMVGGTVIAAAAPEMILAARLALAGCKSNPVLCLNQAGIYAADIAAPEAVAAPAACLRVAQYWWVKARKRQYNSAGRWWTRPVIC